MIRVTVPRPVAEALMDGSLRLLVVDSYWPPGFVTDEDHPPAPRYDVARAIEAGERIGIDVECECACHRLGSQSIAADCRCTNGRVPVGSVRPVRVLRLIDEDQWKAAPGVPDAYTVSPGKPDVVFDPLLRKVDHLSVYGPAESLVGKFAVVCEDARRGL